MIDPDKLAELRRVAEAAPGREAQGLWTTEDDEFANAFDPPTALALLDALAEKDAEIERLREVVAKVPMGPAHKLRKVLVGYSDDAHGRTSVDLYRGELEQLAEFFNLLAGEIL